MTYNADEASQKLTVSDIKTSDVGAKYRCKADFTSDAAIDFNGNIYCAILGPEMFFSPVASTLIRF